MREYVNEVLSIGQGFDKVAAKQYILSIWGSAGTNDLVNFSSSVPSGNVSVASNVKLIADNIEII